MALLWFEGFEGIHTTDGNTVRQTVTDELSRKMQMSYVAGHAPFLRAGEVQGKALSLGDTGNGDAVILGINPRVDLVGATYIVGFRIKLRDHTTGPLQQEVCKIYAKIINAGERQLELVIDYNDSNKLSVRRNGSVIETESTGTLQSNTWHHIEWRFNIHDSTGLYNVRVDDTEVMSGTNVDTKGQGNNNNNGHILAFQGAEGTAGGVDEEFLLDDIYIVDETGSNNNTYLGSNARVILSVPDAEGTTINFTPQTGTDNSAMVDETPPAESDYNDGASNGDIDEYEFQDITETVIYGVRCEAHVGTDTLGRERDFRLRCRSGATVGNGADQSVTDSDIKEELFELDPNTSALWTNANLNAAEFGVEVRD